MHRHMCMNCGNFMARSSASDPLICMECEKLFEGADELERLENLPI